MDKKMPLVSSCIISYNHAAYLPMAIESVLSQTYKNQEIIIVDDGSSDNSLKIIQSYAQRFPQKITVFTHKNHENRGISATCNLGLEKAQGKYISWLGSDDLWLPDKLMWQVELLEQNPKVGLVYSKAITINGEGGGTGFTVGERLNLKKDSLIQILEKNVIPAPTILARRECFEKLGNYDENLVYSDWEMWVRILSHWDLGFVEKPTTLYRVHQKNTSVGINADIDFQRKLQAVSEIVRRTSIIGGKLLNPDVQSLLKKKPSEFKKDVALCHLDNYFILCQSGNLIEAFPHLIKAVKVSPERIIKWRQLGAICKNFGFGLFKGKSKSR